MFGLERMFGKKTKATSTLAELPARSGEKNIAAHTSPKKISPSDANRNPSETKASLVPDKVFPRPAEMARSSMPARSIPLTPMSTKGLDEFRIPKQKLEDNLSTPTFAQSPLPELGRVKDPIAPNHWYADHIRSPKTQYQPTPVSTVGMRELAMDAETLDIALENPGIEGGTESIISSRRKTQSARRSAPNQRVVAPPVALDATLSQVSDGLPNPKKLKNQEWKRAQRVVYDQAVSDSRSYFQTEKEDPDTRWKRMKQAEQLVAGGAKQADGLAVYQGRGPNMPSVEAEKDRVWQEARRRATGTETESVGREFSHQEALRIRRVDKIKQLVQMIRLANPQEAVLMREVLATAVAHYERDHGKYPD